MNYWTRTTWIENSGGASSVAVGDKGRRRRWPRQAVVVVLFVNGMVQLQSGDCVRQFRVDFGRIEPEPELEARLQFVQVVLREALAQPVLAAVHGVVVVLPPLPRLVAEHVRRPRLLLVEWPRRRRRRCVGATWHVMVGSGGSLDHRRFVWIGFLVVFVITQNKCVWWSCYVIIVGGLCFILLLPDAYLFLFYYQGLIIQLNFFKSSYFMIYEENIK